jgi:hypothetical protein
MIEYDPEITRRIGRVLEDRGTRRIIAEHVSRDVESQEIAADLGLEAGELVDIDFDGEVLRMVHRLASMGIDSMDKLRESAEFLNELLLVGEENASE